MNERVKQLWSEAAKSNFGDSWEEQTAFMSKFAELIVRECCQVMESLPSTTYHVGRTRMSEEIMKHFGVKE